MLTVLFLVFNEGYLSTGDGEPVRAELAGEAIRLTRVLRQLLPEEPEVAGLLGLLVLTEARRKSRVRHGQLVPLDEQDRTGWDPSPVVALNRAVPVAELDGRRSPSLWSTGCPSRVTTRGTPPAPTCSAGSAGPPRRKRRTTPRSRPPTTALSAPT